MARVTLRDRLTRTNHDVTLTPCRGTEPDDFLVEIAGESIEVRISGSAGKGVIRINGRPLPFYAVRREDHLEVWLDGSRYQFEVEGKRRRRRSHGAVDEPSDEVRAPMPGSVLKVSVSPGDSVEANQPVAVLESMKMELTLNAPRAGKVAAVDCAVGQMVEMGRVLVRLEPAGNDDSSSTEQ